MAITNTLYLTVTLYVQDRYDPRTAVGTVVEVRVTPHIRVTWPIPLLASRASTSRALCAHFDKGFLIYLLIDLILVILVLVLI